LDTLRVKFLLLARLVALFPRELARSTNPRFGLLSVPLLLLDLNELLEKRLLLCLFLFDPLFFHPLVVLHIGLLVVENRKEFLTQDIVHIFVM
jgi:hypothetical protein